VLWGRVQKFRDPDGFDAERLPNKAQVITRQSPLIENSGPGNGKDKPYRVRIGDLLLARDGFDCLRDAILQDDCEWGAKCIEVVAFNVPRLSVGQSFNLRHCLSSPSPA
jgi:hypothetical protein